MNSVSRVVSIKSRVDDYLMKIPNVVAVGVGEKVSKGERTGEVAIIVSVLRKLSQLMLEKDDEIPSEIDGTKTDVVETGPIYILGYSGYIRPVTPGYSIGHYKITAGTFGCLIDIDDEQYILSNCHVLANSNNANVGDTIYQPGAIDGGNEKVAELADFEPILFTQGDCSITTMLAELFNGLAYGNSNHYMVPKQDVFNKIDSAIAKPTKAVTADIPEIGFPCGDANPTLGMKVRKTGRTTGYQEGEITQTNVTVNVGFGGGRNAVFKDQVIISPGGFSAGGDSGSAILDFDNNVVGLLFAGSDTVTIANRIEHVLARYNGSIVCC